MKKWKQFWKKWRSRFLIFMLLRAGRPLLHAVIKTCRIRVKGEDTFRQTALEEKCILMLWHNRLAPIEYFLSLYAPQECTYGAVISNSRDGELLARVVTSYPQGRAIRVNHRAKHGGLLQMIEQLRVPRTVILITPDGPQGPPYEVKHGIILAAQTTQAKIIPLSWTSSRFWELKTWDRMRIPLPFSDIDVTFGPPLSVDKEADYSIHAHFLKENLNSIDIKK